MSFGACWLAWNGLMEGGRPMPPCTGRIIRAHLISRQVLKRLGADPMDPRSFVPACGGISGVGGHHGLMDSSRTLRVPWMALPSELLEFAEEVGAMPWLEREYKRTRRSP